MNKYMISIRFLDMDDTDWLCEVGTKEVNYYLNNIDENTKYDEQFEKRWISDIIKDKNRYTIVMEVDSIPAGIGGMC